MPGGTPVSTRLPGTDAASFGGDASWRRGVGLLWTFFILIAAGEAFVLAVYLLSGGFYWPKIGDVLRLLALCGVFLALWSGWTWTRWVLAAVALLAGLRTVLMSFLVDYHGVSPDPSRSAQALGTLVYLGALMALGFLYLGLAAYLVFSADVVAFAQHRREKGRGWVIVPVGLLVGGYCIFMLSAELLLRHSLEGMQKTMSRIAQDDMRTLAAQWNPDALKTVLDTEALQGWNVAGREGFMDALRPLGTYLGPGDEDAGVFVDIGGIGTSSFVRGECRETVRCSEGRATLGFLLLRPWFGPWRVVTVNVGDVQFYEPSAHTPATPPPAASPTGWFRSTTPAATPVPSTGG